MVVAKVICPRCGGSGVSTDGRRDCPVCLANGYIKKRVGTKDESGK